MAAQPGGSPAGRVMPALLGPWAIGIAIATVAGAVLVSPLLLIPGAGAWLIAVIATAAARGRKAREARIDTTGLPPSIQRELDGLNRALDQMQTAIATVPADRRVLFADVENQARQVRDAVTRMARSAGALHTYLAANRAGELQGRLEGLRQRLATVGDDAARAEIEAAIGLAEAQLARREQLLATLERYRATLRGLQATAEELAGRAVNLAAGGELAADETFDEQSPARRVTELKASVAALEEVMRTETETL